MPNWFDERSHNRFLSWSHQPFLSCGVVVEGHPLHDLIQFRAMAIPKEDLTPDKAGISDIRNLLEENLEWKTGIVGMNHKSFEYGTYSTRQAALDDLDRLAELLIKLVK